MSETNSTHGSSLKKQPRTVSDYLPALVQNAGQVSHQKGYTKLPLTYNPEQSISVQRMPKEAQNYRFLSQNPYELT